jgi:hypothetical protein
MLAKDPRPGAILALSLLANAPVAVGFVLAPLFAGGDPAGARVYVPWVVWLTAPLAAASVVLYARSSVEQRAHRASRIGLLLAAVALLLWALVVALAARSAR